MKSFFLLALFGLTLAPGWARSSDAPNIIVIFSDDHGWPDIGAANIHNDLKTPHLDALAASGVRATQGYVTAPQCVPSRAGLLSGRSQNRFGVESNGAPLDGFNEQKTIAERLKEAGYATGQIGKWHLGKDTEITSRGFDDVYAKNANRPCSATFTLDGETIPLQVVDDEMYHLDACSQAALSFIRRHEKESFFLYLAYRAPHVPLDAPEKYLSRFPGEMPERRRQALAMISAMDDGVGSIVSELKDRGLSEKTLIFFIGDNGAPLKIHKEDAPGGGPGWDGSLNEPMNGEKGMLSEGGIRVPYLISFPGTIPGGQVYDHPVSSLDVAATAAALAGVSGEMLDGVNLVPFLSGEKDGAPHESLLWRWVSQSAIREGRWKLLRGGDREYLFDIESDPGESENVIAAHPEIAERLRNELSGWAGELNPPGLMASGRLADTWQEYFDVYFDGKPARAPAKAKADPSEALLRGLILRNGEAHPVEGGVEISQPTGSKGNPFLAYTKLKLRGPISVEVTARVSEKRQMGFTWRSKDQEGFPPEQAVRLLVPVSEDWQTLRTELPAEGNTIHFRCLLPWEKVAIQSLVLQDGHGGREEWNFSKSPAE